MAFPFIQQQQQQQQMQQQQQHPQQSHQQQQQQHIHLQQQYRHLSTSSLSAGSSSSSSSSFSSLEPIPITATATATASTLGIGFASGTGGTSGGATATATGANYFFSDGYNNINSNDSNDINDSGNYDNTNPYISDTSCNNSVNGDSSILSVDYNRSHTYNNYTENFKRFFGAWTDNGSIPNTKKYQNNNINARTLPASMEYPEMDDDQMDFDGNINMDRNMGSNNNINNINNNDYSHNLFSTSQQLQQVQQQQYPSSKQQPSKRKKKSMSMFERWLSPLQGNDDDRNSNMTKSDYHHHQQQQKKPPSSSVPANESILLPDNETNVEYLPLTDELKRLSIKEQPRFWEIFQNFVVAPPSTSHPHFDEPVAFSPSSSPFHSRHDRMSPPLFSTNDNNSNSNSNNGTTTLKSVGIAREMNQMSSKEREKVLFDIHGVPSDPFLMETPEMQNQAIRKLNERIQLHLLFSNKKKAPIPIVGDDGTAAAAAAVEDITAAYRLAQTIDTEGYLQSKEHLLLPCLRCEHWDIAKASTRLFQLLTIKLSLFGKDKLCQKSITINDLSDDDLECLNCGAWQWLPTKDAAGRAVLLHLPMFLRYKTHENMLRTMYYMIMSALEEEQTQKKGIVFLFHRVQKHDNNKQAPSSSAASSRTQEQQQEHPRIVNPPDSKLTKKSLKVIHALPMKLRGWHYCVNDRLFQLIFPFVVQHFEQQARVRFRLHCGSHTECLYSIMTFGIPVSEFPVDDRDLGQLQCSNHWKWIAARRHLEVERSRRKSMLLRQQKLRQQQEVQQQEVQQQQSLEDLFTSQFSSIATNHDDSNTGHKINGDGFITDLSSGAIERNVIFGAPPAQTLSGTVSTMGDGHNNKNNNNNGNNGYCYKNNHGHNFPTPLEGQGHGQEGPLRFDLSSQPTGQDFAGTATSDVDMSKVELTLPNNASVDDNMTDMYNKSADDALTSASKNNKSRTGTSRKKGTTRKSSSNVVGKGSNKKEPATGSSTDPTSYTPDEATISGNGQNFVLTPSPVDVLFGRGKPVQEHPGNVALGVLVESLLEQYNSKGGVIIVGPDGKKKKKKKKCKMHLTQQVVHQIQQRGGRFLKPVTDGVWEQVDDETAREKVSHTFRNKKNLLAEQPQQQQSHQEGGGQHTKSMKQKRSRPGG